MRLFFGGKFRIIISRNTTLEFAFSDFELCNQNTARPEIVRVSIQAELPSFLRAQSRFQWHSLRDDWLVARSWRTYLDNASDSALVENGWRSLDVEIIRTASISNF